MPVFNYNITSMRELMIMYSCWKRLVSFCDVTKPRARALWGLDTRQRTLRFQIFILVQCHGNKCYDMETSPISLLR